MTIVFFGSSEFSLAALQECLTQPLGVRLAVTTPNRRKGRGLAESPTPVRLFCEKQGIPVEAPESLKSPELVERIRNLQPELFVVSSYGKMIPSSWLKIPARAALNVHPSLLPKYRGAAPLNWPILVGESETGVSIAEVTDRLDAGDIFEQIAVPIGPRTDSQQLGAELARLSQVALARVLEQIEGGNLKRILQEESRSSYARKLTKEDGLLDWQLSAWELDRKVRGLKPWPGAYAHFRGEPLRILKAHPQEAAGSGAQPGTILEIHGCGFLRIQTGKGALCVETLKPAGKSEMTGAEFAHGKRLACGMLLASP